ncbi:MAG: beta-galactosidase [Pyrinomonadaceae bacterium]
MNDITIGPNAEDFVWASGVEDTFVPQTRSTQRALDEYELMGHYEHWRQDLALARDLKLNALRWGVPWYKVEPEPGKFDWRWTDEVIPYLVEELRVTPIIDLMHYGCLLAEKGIRQSSVSAGSSQLRRRICAPLPWACALVHAAQ